MFWDIPEGFCWRISLFEMTWLNSEDCSSSNLPHKTSKGRGVLFWALSCWWIMSKIQAKSQCPSQAIGVWSWSWHQLDSGGRSFGVIRYLWQAIVWTKRPSRLQVGLGESPWYVGTASGPGTKSEQGTHVVFVLLVQVSTHFKPSSY